MKKAIYLILFSLCWVVSMAQQVELMRIYTDKNCYLAGEDLWVKVNLDDDVLPGNIMSQVAYVEICDTAQIRAQGKIALTDGVGWACIRLPQTMHSGIYQLTAYTQYMRNLKTDGFPRKYIAVVNARVSSDEDHWVANDSTDYVQEAIPFKRKNSLLVGDKEVYGLREKVSLKWSSYFAEAKELTLSVFRKDCEVTLPKPEVAFPEPAKGERWVTECEGHIVTATAMEDSLPDHVLAQLSCLGKELKVFEGKREGNKRYGFYTHDVNGRQDVVLSA